MIVHDLNALHPVRVDLTRETYGEGMKQILSRIVEILATSDRHWPRSASNTSLKVNLSNNLRPSLWWGPFWCAYRYPKVLTLVGKFG